MLKGICHFYSETGTEGGYWAFLRRRRIRLGRKDRLYRESDYKGLHILEDGDKLTVFDPKNRRKKLWSGVISLTQYPPFTQSVFGWRIHADQKGILREKWARFFFKEYPAELIPKRAQSTPIRTK